MRRRRGFAEKKEHSGINVLPQMGGFLSLVHSQGPPCSSRGCPGPLEIKSAEMAGHVNDFSDEKQSWNLSTFHCFTRKLIRVHTACRHFRLLVAFCVGGHNAPRMNLLLELLKA